MLPPELSHTEKPRPLEWLAPASPSSLRSASTTAGREEEGERGGG